MIDPNPLARRGIIGLAVISMAVLGACASGADLSRTNPDYFVADISEGKLSGSYNPAGFGTAEVRDLLAPNCAGKQLSAYSEKPVEGLVAFAATCKGGTEAYGGNIEFERRGDRVIAEGLTYDENGDLTMPGTH
ncbi:hypothetical protein QCN27_13345 [Cereibacter sp. SYSU M97828]|nr:hypothetical protein [Cereibacter flavus]